jgi:hypothetical protein
MYMMSNQARGKPKLTVPGFLVPETKSEWYRLAAKASLTGKTIHDMKPEELGSGSNVSQRQFTMFRAIYREPQAAECLTNDRGIFGLDETWTAAKRICESSPELNNYLNVISKRMEVGSLDEHCPEWPGTFALVRKLQEAGEITPNVSLVLLLQGLLSLCGTGWY